MKLTILFSLITSITFSQVYNFGEHEKRSGNYKYFDVIDGKISAFSTNYKYKNRTELKTLKLDQTNLTVKEINVIKSGGNSVLRGNLNRFKNNICYLDNKAYYIVNETTEKEANIFLREVGNNKNETTIYNKKMSGLQYSKFLNLNNRYVLFLKIQNDEIDGSIILAFDNEFNLVNEFKVESDDWIIYNNYYEVDDKIYFLNSYGGRSHKISIPRMNNSYIDYIEYEFEKDFLVLNYSICESKKGEIFVGCVGLTHNPKEPYGLKVFQLVKDDLHLIDEASISEDMYFADLDEKSKKDKLNYFTETNLFLNRELRDQKSELKNIEMSNGSNYFVFMENHFYGSTDVFDNGSSAEENENFIVFLINEEGEIQNKKVLRHLMTSIGINREISSFYAFESAVNEICIITNENIQMFNSEGEYIPKNKIKKSGYMSYAPFKKTVGTTITINGDEIERKIITSPKSMLAPHLIVEMEPGKLLLYQFSKKSESFGILSY